MPQRVPIKIFRLKQNQSGVFDVAPTRYAQGMTQNDLINNGDGTESIRLQQTPVNQPLAGEVLSRVYSDTTGKYVILDGAEKLYIRTTGAQPDSATPQVFEFYVNPQRLSPAYQKIQTEIRTRGGWEIQHWGDALTELKVEGVSGGTHRRSTIHVNRDPNVVNQTQAVGKDVENDGIMDWESITNTMAWTRLIQLRQLYDMDHSVRNQEQLTLLGISVYDTFYVGYFTQFSGPNHEAEKPYQFSYTFTLKILYETNVTTLSPSIKDVAAAGTRTNLAGAFFSQPFGPISTP
jgi:hypothetical protein